MTTSFDDIALQQQRYTMDRDESARQLDVLMAMINGDKAFARRGRRRRGMIIAIAAATIGVAGVGTAAALGAFSKPTVRTTAFCFASADLSDAPTNRIEIGVTGSEVARDAAVEATEICKNYWRSDLFPMPSELPPIVDPAPGDEKVPSLAACVLPSGHLGVFPGTDATCGRLGLSIAQL